MGIVLNWSTGYNGTSSSVDNRVDDMPTLADGVHDVLASHVNTLADAVVALQTNQASLLTTVASHTSTLTTLSPLTVREQDGSPAVSSVNTIEFTNGTVTAVGGGVVRVSVSGGGGGVADLQEAYDGGNTINTTTGQPVLITVPLDENDLRAVTAHVVYEGTDITTTLTPLGLTGSESQGVTLSTPDAGDAQGGRISISGGAVEGTGALNAPAAGVLAPGAHYTGAGSEDVFAGNVYIDGGVASAASGTPNLENGKVLIGTQNASQILSGATATPWTHRGTMKVSADSPSVTVEVEGGDSVTLDAGGVWPTGEFWLEAANLPSSPGTDVGISAGATTQAAAGGGALFLLGGRGEGTGGTGGDVRIKAGAGDSQHGSVLIGYEDTHTIQSGSGSGTPWIHLGDFDVQSGDVTVDGTVTCYPNAPIVDTGTTRVLSNSDHNKTVWCLGSSMEVQVPSGLMPGTTVKFIRGEGCSAVTVVPSGGGVAIRKPASFNAAAAETDSPIVVEVMGNAGGGWLDDIVQVYGDLEASA